MSSRRYSRNSTGRLLLSGTTVFFLACCLVYLLFQESDVEFGRDHELVVQYEKQTKNAVKKQQPSPNHQRFDDQTPFAPSVCIAVPILPAKNRILPYFLGSIERLDYPADHLCLFLGIDEGPGKNLTLEILKQWLESNSDFFEVKITKLNPGFIQEATAFARTIKVNADYLFHLDESVVLVNDTTLRHLVSLKKPIVAPMLNSTEGSENFDATSDDKFNMLRSRAYQGVFPVKSLRKDVNAVLYGLKRHKVKDYLENFETGDPFEMGIEQFITNDGFFGYAPKPTESSRLFFYNWLQVTTAPEVLRTAVAKSATFLPALFDGFQNQPVSKLGFDEIYLINLAKRPKRLAVMERILEIHGIGFRRFEAIDGHDLPVGFFRERGIKPLEGYHNRYTNKSMTLGEMGEFLSHFHVWKDAVGRNYDQILVLEDDAWLDPGFADEVPALFQMADRLTSDWELCYLGRIRKEKAIEQDFVESSFNRLIFPSSSAWSLSYALSLNGARKLVNDQPIQKMVPIDDYFPIMYDKPTLWDESLLKNFEDRSLVALAVNPKLAYPICHPHCYSNMLQMNLVSDTFDF